MLTEFGDNLDPGGVYSNFKKIIDNQEGVDKPRCDHGQQDAESSENMLTDVAEGTAFWRMTKTFIAMHACDEL